jgi:hypothetical protein
MHAAFLPIKITPYIHMSAHRELFEARRGCKVSRRNKSLNKNRVFTSGHKMGVSATKKSVPKMIMVTVAARLKAEEVIGKPMSSHEKRVIIGNRQMRAIVLDE